LPAMVDLPTPPFRPATAMIAIEVGITIIAYSGARRRRGRFQVDAWPAFRPAGKLKHAHLEMQARISELRSDA
jgi:hypothetical protein